MIFKDVEEQAFSNEYPFLIEWLKDFEKLLKGDREIVVSVSADSITPTFSVNGDNAEALNDRLQELISGFCWKCGVTGDRNLDRYSRDNKYICFKCLFDSVDEQTYLNKVWDHINFPLSPAYGSKGGLIRCFTEYNDPILCKLSDLKRTENGSYIGWYYESLFEPKVHTLGLKTRRKDINGNPIFSHDVIKGSINSALYPDLEYLKGINDESLKEMCVVRTTLPNNPKKYVWALATLDSSFPIPLKCIKDPVIIGTLTSRGFIRKSR